MASTGIGLDDDDLRAKIARATPTANPLTLRGVPSAAAPAQQQPIIKSAIPSGSTASLEDSAARIPSQMGASLRTATQPEAPSPLQQQTTIDRGQQANLDKGSGIAQIAKAHPIAGGLLRGVNTIGSIAGAVFPQIHSVMGAIPGTEEHHQRLVGQNTQAIANDEGQAKEQADTGHLQAETDTAPSTIDLNEAKAEEALHPQPKMGEAEQPLGNVAQMNQALARRFQVLHPGQQLPPEYTLPPNAKTGDYSRINESLKNEEGAIGTKQTRDNADADRHDAAATRASDHEQSRQDRLALQQSMQDSRNFEHNRQTENDQERRAAAEDKKNQPTPDEKRRSDMSQNLNENLNALEDIVNKNPGLFGPISGRLTGIKSALGTNDPDIGALETLKHQLGMVQISAHGMRSAQGIAGAADSILNNFHNGPDAMKAAINAARNSAGTFQKDAGQNPGATEKGGHGAPQGPPQGATHTAKGSDGQLHYTNSKGEDLGVARQ